MDGFRSSPAPCSRFAVFPLKVMINPVIAAALHSFLFSGRHPSIHPSQISSEVQAVPFPRRCPCCRLLPLIPAHGKLKSLTVRARLLLSGGRSPLGGDGICWKIPSSPGMRRVAAARKFPAPFFCKTPKRRSVAGRRDAPSASPVCEPWAGPCRQQHRCRAGAGLSPGLPCARSSCIRGRRQCFCIC